MQREIIFRDITTGEISHTTTLDTAGIADYRSVLGWLTKTIMRDLRLFSGYNVLYGKVKAFVRDELFDKPVELDDANTMRNLSELAATKTIIESFKKAINALTVRDKGDAEIRDHIKLCNTRPFMVTEQESLPAKKSVFNRIIGDSHFELEFASFLENCKDVLAYAKNYLAVNFKLDYINRDGNISYYYPDFIVKLPKNRIVIVETKGNADLDTPLKMERLRQWCNDVNKAQNEVKYECLYVEQEEFEKYKVKLFVELSKKFSEY